ncbi:hypothetical protein HBA55_30100 [Pseudomaricurvus alkylphenolicus]|jgi:hypothetical protein|uniref:hypothetical protein n=1 Tax=Pseudomaricurvus alkylphenolicus TaxID=1306991 RepID=UPI00141E831F|nr:hypothetical protein [Pseudomaricurvus alkylphenolicus]NIB43893.1 hypothetical protein [Pseudomaricurvus alkylphenolicus]
MKTFINQVNPGDVLITPGSRHLMVSDVFVPRNSPGVRVPSQFRSYARKIVMFQNGTVAPLADVKRHYRAADAGVCH